jgi:hypothetical protein
MEVNDYHCFLMLSISGVQILADMPIVFIPVISGYMVLPGNCYDHIFHHGYITTYYKNSQCAVDNPLKAANIL